MNAAIHGFESLAYLGPRYGRLYHNFKRNRFFKKLSKYHQKIETRIVSMSALQNIYSKLRIPVGLFKKSSTHFF